MLVTELCDELRDQTAGTEVADLTSNHIQVDLTADEPAIEMNLDGRVLTLPATNAGVDALAKWVDVPNAFLHRQDFELRQMIINHLLHNSPGIVQVHYGQDGIHEVRDPGKQVIPLWRYAEMAASVVSPAAPVVEVINEPNLFRLDVTSPEGFDRGMGGDRAVGDLCRGGITIEQDRRANLAPMVGTYLYRLLCTNGMVHREASDKVDARGQTVDEVLIELELLAQRMFARAEDQMTAFYDLRNQPVDEPERTVIRLAREQGLPDRTVLRLAERVPEVLGGDGVSMFEIVNMITNEANNPTIRGQAGTRRTLERIGGAVVTSHAQRCPSCLHKLGN